jgi:hypothetical protein
LLWSIGFESYDSYEGLEGSDGFEQLSGMYFGRLCAIVALKGFGAPFIRNVVVYNMGLKAMIASYEGFEGSDGLERLSGMYFGSLCAIVGFERLWSTDFEVFWRVRGLLGLLFGRFGGPSGHYFGGTKLESSCNGRKFVKKVDGQLDRDFRTGNGLKMDPEGPENRPPKVVKMTRNDVLKLKALEQKNGNTSKLAILSMKNLINA